MVGWDVNSGAGAAGRAGGLGPSPARVYDYLLGGKDNFRVDRDAAQRVVAMDPAFAGVARANRRFVLDAVTRMARAGIDQFVDLGAGIPTSPNVHEAARSVRPGARVVYVDRDPVVVSHSRALRAADGVAIVHADAGDTGAILADPALRDVIDFDQPVGVLAVALLHFIVDADHPGHIAADWHATCPPGSVLAISHGCADHLDPHDAKTISAAYDGGGQWRSRDQIVALTRPWRLRTPLTPVRHWPTTKPPERSPGNAIEVLCALADHQGASGRRPAPGRT